MKKPLFKNTFLLIILIWSLTKEANAQIQGLSNIPISLKINQPVQTFESIRNDANNYFIPLRAKNDGNPIQEEKVFRRWEYYTKSRCMYPGAPVGGSVFGVEQYMKSVNGFYVCNTGYSSSPWTSIGQNPTPIDKQDIGIIISVEVDPNNSNILYAGSNTAGLWKTTNGGTNWVNKTDILGIASLGINAIAVDPTNSNNILAGTGTRSYGWAWINPAGIGVIRSSDGGETWTTTSIASFPGDFLDIEVIKYNPINSNIVYVAGNKKIWKSIDGGITWGNPIFTNPNPQNANFIDFEINSINPNVLYASTNWSGQITTGSGAEFFTSLDGGASWYNFSPPNRRILGSTNTSICPDSSACDAIAIDVTPADPNKVFISFHNGGGIGSEHFVMMSTNNGTTWNIISRNPITHYISNSDCFYNFPIEGWGWWKHEFEVSNTNINTFYLGGNTMYKSTNAGVTWSSISQYSPTISPTLPAINTTHADIRALLQLTSLTGDYLIIGNDGGIAKTTNGGALWTNINGSGLLITQFYSFGSFISNKNLVGGTQDNGTKFKNGSTNLWASSVLGGDGGWTEVNYANDNIVYASVYDYIYKSTTGGESGYSSISNPGGSYTLGRRFHVDASNPNKLWWGYKNLYVYDEPTNIWSLKFTAPPPLSNFTDISAIKVAPSNGNIIYVAYWGPTWGNPRLNKLLKTTNGGTTWIDISNNFSAYDWTYISDFEIDPYNPNRVWASCAGYWPGSPPNEGQGANRVVFSNDGGLTWNDNSIGLPPIPVNCLVYQNGTDDVIYSGTDAGVYRWNKTIQAWECFNNGFPASIITKLVIDNCKNKILASTFGRGIWEAPLPNTAEYHITTSQTWDAFYNRSFNNDVIVDYGVAFTIKGTLNFAGNKKLVIMPNAKLIIDGGKITNGCGAQWQGIEVWGTTNQHQYPVNGVCAQGSVELKNGAVIENAYNGITNWKPDDWNSIGGIIIANNATFRNNRRSVEFMSYRNFDPATGVETDNLSNFINCSFEVNDAYPSGASPFVQMVSLWKVKGVTFAGCDFLNNRTNNFTGQAIGSLDAGYKILALAGAPADRSFFKNFAYGIQASNSQTVNSIYVDNAKFTSNGNGIDLTAINGAVIINSLFDIGTAPNCPNQGFGITTNSCSGYAIEQNTFTGSTAIPGTTSTGISITNSGQTYNEVYKNSFQNVTYGNNANLQNALSYPLYGLTYLCNTNTGNKYDFYVTGNPASMISPYQRSGSSIATGNTFSTNAINNFYNGGRTPVFYYHSTGQAPLSYSGIQLMTAGSNTCPLHYGGSSTSMITLPQSELDAKELEFAEAFAASNNVNTLYESLKDGGSTTTTVENIENSMPSDMWELRSKLLGVSPHLSQEALRAASLQTNVLPQSVLFEILAANPDEMRDENFLSFLQTKENPLPEYMIDLLRQIAGNKSYKTVLLEKMNIYESQKSTAASDILRSKLNDSVVNLATIINWLDNKGDLASHYQIVDAYLQSGYTTTAQSMLKLIPTLHKFSDTDSVEYQKFSELKALQINFSENGRSLAKCDSTEKAQLIAIADFGHGIASAQAQGMLGFWYGIPYCNCVNYDDKLKHTAVKTGNMASLPSGIKISANPNPATTWVTFEFELPDEISSIKLTISDAQGRTVDKLTLTGRQGQKLLDIRRYSSGIYFYNSGKNERVVGKFIVK